MLSVMEELSRKTQALSAVRQQAQPCPPKGSAARHPSCAWGWHRAALGIAHEPSEGPRLEDATLARAAEFGRFPVWPLSGLAAFRFGSLAAFQHAGAGRAARGARGGATLARRRERVAWLGLG